MADNPSSAAQIQLHLLSFDAPGALSADWLTKFLGQWASGAGIWLLLEQMHRFDFVGPDVSSAQPLITIDSLCTYGLRGRLFWETGQIEWRRLAPDNLRLVVASEGSITIAAPDNINVAIGTQLSIPSDSRLILWGTSRSDGKFREQRVAGSAVINYPDLLTQAASQLPGITYPVLPFRRYVDGKGREQFRRFLPPRASSERDLFSPLATDNREGEVQNA